MQGSAAHFELQGNLLARQPKSPQPTDGVLSVTLNNGPCLLAGENVDGTIVLHPVVANQVKRVSLTIRGSSPLADNPKTSLFWIENYTIYVSNRKSRHLLDGQPLVLDFSEALPSSSSSKRVRDPMTCAMVVDVEIGQSSFLHTVPFSVTALGGDRVARSRPPSPYPYTITRSSTASSSSSKGRKRGFWPFK